MVDEGFRQWAEIYDLQSFNDIFVAFIISSAILLMNLGRVVLAGKISKAERRRGRSQPERHRSQERNKEDCYC